MYSNSNQIQIKASSRQPSAFQFRLMVGIVAIGFIAGTIALQSLHWQGNRSLHTIMEIIATLLATFVGLLAFLRFYSRKSSSYLLLATGFIGTALLDGYHAVVTSSLLGYIMPSPPDSLIPWSWNASRTFLAILMAIMWFVSRWEKKHGRANILPEAVVIIAVGGLTLTSFCFFAFYPLPRAYYPEFFFGRPEEFVAAFFFAIALFGFISKADQDAGSLYRWLVWSMLIGFVSQAFVMSRSFALFDLPFDLAHTLKIVSYFFVLVGLLADTRRLFQQSEQSRNSLKELTDQLTQQTAQANSLAAEACAKAIEAEESNRARLRQEIRTEAILKEMIDAVATINEKGIIEEFNVAAEKMFGYSSNEVLGKNISMLMPAPYRDEHDGYLEKYMATGRKHVIGIGRDVAGLHKDGTEFPAHLAVSEVTVYDPGSENSLRLFTGIIRDLTKQKEAESHLLHSMQVAKTANQAKSEFLANMSHEIRTPMTAILGYVDLLLEEGDISKASKERIETITTIQRNAHHLMTIINDILDMSKIEAGKMSVEQVKTKLTEVTNEVALLMRTQATGKGIELRIEYVGLIPEKITSDPTRLRQILMNLVGNALKFTEVGSVTIRVSLASDGDKQGLLKFAVIDTGIGMTREQRDATAKFDAFTQADTSTTRKFGGSGLGLRISNSLSKMLGGCIEIESEKDKGSIFTAFIDPGNLDGVTMLTSEEIEGNTKQTIATIIETVSSENNKPLQGIRILFAEDGPDNQRLISFLLKKAGAIVELAENGRIAVDKIHASIEQDNPFDLTLMDMQMPELDGYEATRQLRREGYAGPIIALTAHAMAEDRQKCLDSGCDDYATKPLDRERLFATILKYAVPVEVVA